MMQFELLPHGNTNFSVQFLCERDWNFIYQQRPLNVGY